MVVVDLEGEAYGELAPSPKYTSKKYLASRESM